MSADICVRSAQDQRRIAVEFERQDQKEHSLGGVLRFGRGVGDNYCILHTSLGILRVVNLAPHIHGAETSLKNRRRGVL